MEAYETQVWLDFSKAHGYLTDAQYDYFTGNYDHICRMLFSMMKNLTIHAPACGGFLLFAVLSSVVGARFFNEV
jgi:hypothetical protein